MKKSEIEAMNRSFEILEERRATILDDERTIKLKEHVKSIRNHSIDNMDELIDEGINNLQKNGDRGHIRRKIRKCA